MKIVLWRDKEIQDNSTWGRWDIWVGNRRIFGRDQAVWEGFILLLEGAEFKAVDIYVHDRS